MKFNNRGLPAIIACAIICVAVSCSKEAPTDYSNRGPSYLYAGDPSSPGRNTLTSGTAYRVLLNSSPVTSIPTLCGTVNAKNFTRNGIAYGQISVGNDSTDYYISLSGVGGWLVEEIQLYAGEENNIPVNPGNGAPIIALYPLIESLEAPYLPTWSIKVPISEMGPDFFVSCRVRFINAAGAAQIVWSDGELFNNVSSASKFKCEQQDCLVNEGCAYGQGTWFGNGNLTWPDVNGSAPGDITVGSEDYSRAEARSIWDANNGNCNGITDTKRALAFIASIRLNGASVIGNTTLWDDVATVDAWLESLDRLTDINICDQPDAPLAIKDAIARISAWIIAHPC